MIGWREYVDLPEWGIEYVVAKADTGARTSALDVGHLEEIGENRVRFDVATSRKRTDKWVTVEADVKRRARIKSSFGAAHERIIVETTLRLGGIEKTVELGLVNRKRMLCRMLIGRKSLEPEFLVDSGHTYRFGRRRKSWDGGESGPGPSKKKKRKKGTKSARGDD